MTNTERWTTLERECSECKKCSLYETRSRLVFGVGPRDAEVMCVGEAPGADEDRLGEPFVGRGGRLLDEMLDVIGLSREKNVYIANIVKCRPPENRDPLNMEQQACIDWLRAQFMLIRPKILICLGRIAAGVIIVGNDKNIDFKITRDHGKWYEKNGVQITAVYHPAALLRDPNRKPETFADLRSIRAKIKEICVRTYTD